MKKYEKSERESEGRKEEWKVNKKRRQQSQGSMSMPNSTIVEITGLKENEIDKI